MSDRVTVTQLRNLVEQVAEEYHGTDICPETDCEHHEYPLMLHNGSGKYSYQLRVMDCDDSHGQSAVGPNAHMTARGMKRYLQGLLEGARAHKGEL